jgi:hypothetical protein
MPRNDHNQTRRLFPAAFCFACLLFWWLPDLLFRWLHLSDPIDRWTLTVSLLALLLFLAGYLLPQRASGRPVVSLSTMDLCENFAWRATLAMAIPAFVVALAFAARRFSLAYGEGGDIPFFYQAVLYTHLFLGYLYLSSVSGLEGRNRRRVLLVCALLILPRLIISLHWARFFVGQTIVVILLMAMARGWMRISFRRGLELVLIAVFIVFVPSWTRGDRLTGTAANGVPGLVAFFQQGSDLQFLQTYRHGLSWTCQPLLVSLTAQLIPYRWLHRCTIDVGSATAMPATIDDLLTRQESDDLATGSGGNYLLELLLLGGLPAVFMGSALFGVTCRWFAERLAFRSLVSGVWAECLVRALLAPRGSLGYVYQRIPSLLLATLAVVILCRSADILRHGPEPYSAPGAAAEGSAWLARVSRPSSR